MPRHHRRNFGNKRNFEHLLIHNITQYYMNPLTLWIHRNSSVSSKRSWPVGRPGQACFSQTNTFIADTNRVKAATAALQVHYYPLPESLTILLQLLLSDRSSPLRQLAATQARKLVPKHWKNLPAEQKTEYRRQLLQGTLREEEQIIRHAAARVITSIAKIDLENNEWLDVFDVLLRAASNPDARQRGVGTYLLFTSLESIGEAMIHRFHEMLEIFSKTIRKTLEPTPPQCAVLLTAD